MLHHNCTVNLNYKNINHCNSLFWQLNLGWCYFIIIYICSNSFLFSLFLLKYYNFIDRLINIRQFDQEYVFNNDDDDNFDG